MAQKDVQTHIFSLNRVNYEIDLTSDNYDKLFEALTPFIDKGRRVGRTKAGGGSRKAPTDSPSAEVLRAWARENNYQMNERGRVPASIREAYQKAH